MYKNLLLITLIFCLATPSLSILVEYCNLCEAGLKKVALIPKTVIDGVINGEVIRICEGQHSDLCGPVTAAAKVTTAIGDKFGYDPTLCKTLLGCP